MGHILTSRHSSLFKKIGLKNLILFIHDAYKSQKITELISFTVWELFHTLRLYPKNKYLKFNNNEVVTLNNGNLNDDEFKEKMRNSLVSSELLVSTSHHNWKLLYIDKNNVLIGCLYTDDRILYKSTDNGKSLYVVGEFPESIKSIFISSQNTIFVCVKGAVYNNSAKNGSFKMSLELCSKASFFRYNNGMTEIPDGTLIIAEYGNIWDKNGWRKLAYLYSSTDNGKTWERSDILIRKGTNKHVHLVKYSKLLDKILVADGDNKKKLWICEPTNSFEFKNLKLRAANKFHIQMGGYTSIIESNKKIIFGTDYQGGTNFIVETKDGEKFTKKIVPDPYRRSPIDNMVQRKSHNGNEIWANLPYSTPSSKCLLMYTANDGKSWNKVIEYNRSTHKVWIISSAKEITDVLYISVENLINKTRVVFKIIDSV